jgi:hypothetical protein
VKSPHFPEALQMPVISNSLAEKVGGIEITKGALCHKSCLNLVEDCVISMLILGRYSYIKSKMKEIVQRKEMEKK